MTRVAVSSQLLQWACERTGIDREDLLAKFKKLPEWERGDQRPTLKQLESFARIVHVPIGYLFLAEPQENKLREAG